MQMTACTPAQQQQRARNVLGWQAKDHAAWRTKLHKKQRFLQGSATDPELAHQVCAPLDVEQTLRDLQSSHEETRLRAARALCPCRSGWQGFEQLLPTLRALSKDPNPQMRAIILHIFEDADKMDSSGLQTHRREATNEMLCARRASRFRTEAEDWTARQQEKRKDHRSK